MLFRQLVDGVLTSDGDAIVYGAQVVYKGIFTDKKVFFNFFYIKLEIINSCTHR